MRPKERIPIILNNIDFDRLEEIWHTTIPLLIREEILTPNGYIIQYWEKNYDQRFGQMLINLNLIEDDIRIWSMEDLKMLLEIGCNPRDVVLWGSIYDKDRNRLKKTQYKLLKDMDTDHIEAILKDVKDRKYRISEGYTFVFEEELKYRNRNNQKND